jgi:hypothetical protein
MVRVLACGSFLVALAGLSGCGLGSGSPSISTAVSPAVKATGLVHGGQQPVTGATIQLWQVGTTGFGSAATALITTTVTTSDGTSTTDSNANAGNANNTLAAGSFTLNFTNAYTCPTASTLVYMTATGGNPGLGGTVNNSASVLLAALGQCGSLNSGTFIILNEVTTAATVESLAAFMSGTGSIGSPSDAVSQLALSNAFAGVNTMVSVSTGAALSGYPKLSTIANALVPCVNSTGPTSSDCTALFADATPSGGTAPSTILGAALNIALNPSLNTTAIYNLSTANAPFQPSLTSAPGLWNITTSGSAKSACGVSGGGDTVTGTVAYSGSKTGHIYLALNNTTGCAVGAEGTSITAAGTYTIHGVPPGTYTLQAFMDTRGYGADNAADPSATTSSFTVNAANYTAPTLTLTDPATVTVTGSPTLKSVGGTNTGAVAQFKEVSVNGVEAPTSYTLQWSTTSAFTAVAGSQTFAATGNQVNVWLVHGLTDSSIYYFRAYGTSAGTAVGPYSAVYGPVTIGPLSSGSTVSGAISFTGAAAGPMYAGFYNQDNNTTPAYLEYLPSPASAQAFSINIPNSTPAVYIPVAIVDQNNNGVVDFGDITNVNFQGGPIAVTGATANQNLTLPTGNAIANVSTQHFESSSGQSYGLYFNLNWAAKLPVAVTLLNSYNTDGANIDNGPLDIASCAVPNVNCSNGQNGFQIFLNLGSSAPATGDSYVFNITYSDGTTGTVIAQVTNVLSTFATSMAPQTGGSTSTTPTFTWTDPVCGACSTYTYSFYLADSSNNGIWQVPGNGNGLPPGTNSITWAVDPTNSNNSPSVGSLTLGASYTWSVTVQDSSYNQAIYTVTYQP